jgi:acyl carrier protein
VASVPERVIDIVADQLGVDKDKITPDTSFVNDLGADSLDTVELVMELEEEFDITIPDDAAEKIQTVGQAIDFIEKSQDS